MEKLIIVQEGIGELTVSGAVPEQLAGFILPSALPQGLEGEGCQALFQCLPGRGFTVWHSRYRIEAPTILRATGGQPALELRIALRGKIRGTWDKIVQPELPRGHYQFSFVPHVVTRALFEAGITCETFDIHFELSFLEELGIDYATFLRFIEQVLRNQPAELNPDPRPCPPLMTEAVRAILRNPYTPSGKAWLLRTCVENILLAALEDVDRTERILPEITAAQREALEAVKRLIEENVPDYPGNTALCRKTCLNMFIFNFGFKWLYGVTPYKYYNRLRMEQAKELLLKGESINAVAAELNYESARAFSKAFKDMFSMAPSLYKAGFKR